MNTHLWITNHAINMIFELRGIFFPFPMKQNISGVWSRWGWWAFALAILWVTKIDFAFNYLLIEHKEVRPFCFLNFFICLLEHKEVRPSKYVKEGLRKHNRPCPLLHWLKDWLAPKLKRWLCFCLLLFSMINYSVLLFRFFKSPCPSDYCIFLIESSSKSFTI